MRTLDLSLLRTFVMVADRGSMTRAANALNLTQGAVSQHIRRLEEQLTCELFRRERRSLRLTPSGENLIERARQVLAAHDRLWWEMTGRNVSGRVRLDLPDDLAGYAAPVLKTYAETFPCVDMSLICRASPDLLEALAAGEIDLAILEEPLGATAGERLSIEPLVWVGVKGGIAHTKRPVPVSLIAETCAFRPVVLSALRQQDVACRIICEGGLAATTAIVRADLAVTASLTCAVPAGHRILPAGSGLPDLPNFAINLHLPPGGAGAVASSLAKCVRNGLTRRSELPLDQSG